MNNIENICPVVTVGRACDGVGLCVIEAYLADGARDLGGLAEAIRQNGEECIRMEELRGKNPELFKDAGSLTDGYIDDFIDSLKINPDEE